MNVGPKEMMITQFITGLYLMLSMAFQSCDDPQFPYDYSLEMELRKKNFVYVSLEKQRMMDQEYLNYEAWLTHRWKFLEMNAKTLRLDGRDITIYQVDLRGVYKDWSAGIGGYWHNNDAEIRFYFGKQLDFDINFFLFPLELSFKSDVSTKDFITYYHEEHLWLTFDFVSFLDLYVKGTMKDFGYIRFSTSCGIKVNL